jgi:hypothetical protein
LNRYRRRLAFALRTRGQRSGSLLLRICLPSRYDAGELARLAAALDSDELALAAHIHINELPLVTAARAIGWTVHRVDRARKRLQRKFEKFARTAAPPTRRILEDPPRYSLPQYEELLGNGRRCWSMRFLPRTYIEVIENSMPILEIANQLNSKEVSRNAKGIRSPRKMKPVAALKQELVTEQSRLLRIGERAHKCRVTADAAAGPWMRPRPN